ncbi:11398_t:CDS:2, partial [Cetraspora pellucida]
MKDLPNQKQKLAELLLQYKSENIYNADETSLYYYDEESDVEIEKIPHSIALEQCNLLIQYIEQQEPGKFVKDQDLPQLQNLLRQICLNVFKSKEQKK